MKHPPPQPNPTTPLLGMGAGRGMGRSGGLTDRLMTYAQRVVAGSLALVSFAGVTYIGLAFAEMVQAGAGRRTHSPRAVSADVLLGRRCAEEEKVGAAERAAEARVASIFIVCWLPPRPGAHKSTSCVPSHSRTSVEAEPSDYVHTDLMKSPAHTTQRTHGLESCSSQVKRKGRQHQ